MPTAAKPSLPQSRRGLLLFWRADSVPIAPNNAKPVTDRPKARRGTTGTNNRNNDVAPVTAVSLDWDSIPGNQREKLSHAKQAIRPEVERNTPSSAEVDQYKTQTDRSLADYKAKLKAETDVGRARRDEERERYKAGIQAHRAEGLITPGRLQPHPVMPAPDGRNSVTDEKARAFRTFNDQKVKFFSSKGINSVSMTLSTLSRVLPGSRCPCGELAGRAVGGRSLNLVQVGRGFFFKPLVASFPPVETRDITGLGRLRNWWQVSHQF